MVLLLLGCVDSWCSRFNLQCEVTSVEVTPGEDLDGDLWIAGDDCDDTNAAINPLATEVCDAADNDCDDLVDDNDDPIAGQSTWYVDADQDGFSTGEAVVACFQPPETTTSNAGWDCDDADANAYPGGAEVPYDGIDQDCSGADLDDLDGDGWDPPEDCDDAEPLVSPDQEEVCDDGLDNDCDGELAAGCWTASLAEADLILTDALDERAGIAVAWGGDVDGDGRDDLLVGAYRAEEYNGAVYAVTGSPLGTVALSDHLRLAGEEKEVAGISLASAGDIDDDGYDDVLLGAPGADPAGQVYLLHGPLSSSLSLADAPVTIDGIVSEEGVGAGVAGLGDVDGDGIEDLAVSTWESGVYLLSGASAVSSTTVASAAATLTPELLDGYPGRVLASAGDADGDGIDDLLVGDATSNNYYGNAYLVLLPVSGTLSLGDADTRFRGDADTVYLGASVAGGDVDGDGRADVLLGATGTWVDDLYCPGAAHLFTSVSAGTFDASAAAAALLGEEGDDQAGSAVSIPGDLDGDGLAELVVGASANDGARANAGAVYVVWGSGLAGTTALANSAVTLEGESTNAFAGVSLGGRGDMDGDGIPDVLLGTNQPDAAGAAYVLLGSGF